MPSSGKISPTGDKLLVKLGSGSPFDVLRESVIVTPGGDTRDLTRACWGEVIEVGDSPYIPDDHAAVDRKVKVGDIVVFAPSTGFKIDASQFSEPAEYRLIPAGAVHAFIEKE